MKRLAILKVFCILIINSIVFLSLSSQGVISYENGKKKLLVVNDTVYDTRESFDTIIIGENGLVYADYPGLREYLRLENGGRLVGRLQSWIGMHEGATFINNSGPDAVENMTMSLWGNNVTIGGEYPVNLVGMYNGFGMRSPYLETDIFLNGRIFNGNINIIFSQGNNVLLGPNVFYQSLGTSDDVILVQNGAVISQQIEHGGRYMVPLSEEDNRWSARVRSDFYITVNPDAVLGPNATVHLRLITNMDSLPDFAVGEATNAHLYRFVEVTYEDIEEPDFNFELHLGPEGIDIAKGQVSEMRSAFYSLDNQAWHYQDTLQVEELGEKIVLKNIKEEGIISAGSNLGVNEPVCYYPLGVRLNYLGQDSAHIIWNPVSTVDTYLLQYKLEGETEWQSISVEDSQAELGDLVPSSIYSIRLASVCSGGEDQGYSPEMQIETSLDGYYVRDNGKKSLYVTSDRVIPSYLEYDSIIIQNGAKAVLTNHITVQTIIFVKDHAHLDLDRYSIYGNCFLIVQDSATLEYNNVYLINENSFDAAFKSTRRNALYFANPPSSTSKSIIKLSGGQLVGEGMMINSDFPNSVGSIVIDVKGRVRNKADAPIILNDSLVIRNAKAFTSSSAMRVDGGLFRNEVPELEFDGELQFSADTSLVVGETFNIKSIRTRDSSTYVRLYADIIADRVNLDLGQLNCGSQTLESQIFSADGGFFVPSLGQLAYNIQEYGKIELPYKTAGGNILNMEFIPRNAVFNTESLFFLSFVDDVESIPMSLGAAQHYLKRYASVTHNMSFDPEYSIAFDYTEGDIVGNEAALGGTLYDIDATQWLKDHVSGAFDTVAKRLTFNRITGNKGFTAGAFIGFDRAEAFNLRAVDVTPTMADLEWDSHDPDFGITWSLGLRKVGEAWDAPSEGSAQYPIKLTSLESDTEYEWFLRPDSINGYISYGDSDTMSFTTLPAGCEQPRKVGYSGYPSQDSIKWEDGEAPFTVKLSPKASDWNDTLQFSGINDVVISIEDTLELATYYYAFVKSNCGASSDTILFHTHVPGWEEETNTLVVSDSMEIPSGFVFDNILIESTGIAVVTDDLMVNDTLIIYSGGKLKMGTHVLTGFTFIAEDSSFLETAHPHSLTKEGTQEGSVQFFNRTYSPEAYFTLNGTQNQYLYRFMEESSSFNNLTFDNTDTIIISGEWELKLITGEHHLNSGYILFNELNRSMSIGPNTTFYNNANPDALNGGNVFMKINGGHDGRREGGVLGKGSSVTLVDSVYCQGNDEAIIKGDLQVKHKVFTRNAPWYKGFEIDGGRMILESGVVVQLIDPSHGLHTVNGGFVQFMISEGLKGEEISFRIGDETLDARTVKFVLHEGILGTDAYVQFSFHDGVHPEQDPAIQDSVLHKYLSITFEDMHNIQYDLSFAFKNSDIPGGLSANTFRSTLYDSVDGVFIPLDALNTSSSLVEAKNIKKEGDLTAIFRLLLLCDNVNLDTLYTKNIIPLTPAFDNATKLYVDSVRYSTKDVPEFVAVTQSAYAEVKSEMAVSFDDTTKIWVVAEDSTVSDTFRISYVKLPVSTDATLDTIYTLDSTPLYKINDTAFVDTLAAETVEVPGIVAIASDYLATVDINTAATFYDTATITVTAEDSTTQKVYTVVYYKPLSSNVNLDTLYTKDTIPLTPAFDNATKLYVDSVRYSTKDVPDFVALAQSPHAVVGSKIAASFDDTTKIWVVAEDFTVSDTFRITYFKLPVSTDATLDTLYTLDSTPLYSINDTAFVDTLGAEALLNEVPGMVAIASDYLATVVIDTAATFYDTATITVTAEDSTTQKVYTVVYYKPLSNNANLVTLMVDTGMLSPAFDPERTDYVVTLPESTTEMPTLNYSKVSYWASTVLDSATDVTSENQEDRTAKIIVTAEDGTEKVYTIVFVIASLPNYGYGPGGIGTFDKNNTAHPYMALWLRADVGVEMNEEKVSVWRNQTGDFNHATDDFAGEKPNTTFFVKEAPKFSPDAIGGMPALNFGDPGGERYALTIDNYSDPEVPRLDDASDLSVFMVFSRKEINNPEASDFRAIMQKRLESSEPPTNRAWVLEFDGGAQLNQMQWAINRDYDRLDILTQTVFDLTNKTHITGAIKGSYEVEGNTYQEVRMYTDGARERVQAYNTEIVKSVAPTVIGQAEYADIGDIIVYRDFINHAQAVILTNHLASKYNGQVNDYLGQNVPTFLRKGNTRFDMIGVGRAGHQVFTHAASKGGGIILEATNISGNNSYAFAAHADSTGVAVEEDANGVWSRFYYVQNSITIEGTEYPVIEGLNLYFDFTSVGLTDPGEVGDYKLYYSGVDSSNWIEMTDYNSVEYVLGTIRFTFTNMPTGFYTIGKDLPAYEIEDIDEGVGIDLIEEKSIDLNVYPVPVSNLLYVDLNDNKTLGSFVINLYDYTGIRVLSEKTTGSLQLDVSRLTAGFYVLEVISADGSMRVVRRIVKQ